MASLATRLAKHPGWWRDRIPESVVLVEARDGVSDPARLDAVLSMLDGAPAGRTVAVAMILDGLVAYLVGLTDRLALVADAPARWGVRLVLADLEDRLR